MARKSRKNTQTTNFTTNKKTYSVGIYVRLSRFDNEKDNSTIENQKNIILDFIENKSEFNLISIYEDINKTGTDFNRSAFEALLEDVKQGKINCIIVKDLSRFGRNYIECGNYLEKIFPFLNVRFIAINDNYDSDNENSSEILLMHLKNVVNEIYAKDISKKINTVFDEKRKRGDFLGSWASYGYLKNPNNKNKIIVNEETAPIVQRIFNLRLQNYSYKKIAILLNEENILFPYAYLYEKGILKSEKNKGLIWKIEIIKKILINEVYIGNMIQKKTKLLKNKKRIYLPKEDFIKIENNHTPIISKEVFYQVQKINEKNKKIYCSKNNKKTLNKKDDSIFKGFVVCGECGSKLHRVQIKYKANNKKYNYFVCKLHKYKKCNFISIKERSYKGNYFCRIKKTN